MYVTSLALAPLMLLPALVHGAVISPAMQGRAATTCVAADVATVQQQIEHDVYFCDFYLSYPQTTSPLSSLNSDALWNACVCVIASATTPRRYSTTTVPSSTACSAYTQMLADEYHDPSAFCEFYGAQDQTRSTMPGVSVSQIENACSCLPSASVTSTTSTAWTTCTTITSTVQYASTITSTCAKTLLGSSDGSFASGLASWTASVYPEASANISTTTEDVSNEDNGTGSVSVSAGAGFSNGSNATAAVLTCTYSTANDSYASLCSKQLATCSGLDYFVGFDYKFPAGGAYLGGSLSLYDFDLDELLDTISGPTTIYPSSSLVPSMGNDSAGIEAGIWGSVGEAFEADKSGDQVCIILQCLATKSLSGETAQVTIDNVQVMMLS